MEPAVKQGLILGAVAGLFLGIAMYALTDMIGWLLLIPFGAIMGAAPQLLRPPEDD